jgi:hypothetical protein
MIPIKNQWKMKREREREEKQHNSIDVVENIEKI